jgi:hypothetical protein
MPTSEAWSGCCATCGSRRGSQPAIRFMGSLPGLAGRNSVWTGTRRPYSSADATGQATLAFFAPNQTGTPSRSSLEPHHCGGVRYTSDRIQSDAALETGELI